MRVWNLLCVAAMAVSVAAAGQQPTAKEIVTRFNKDTVDYAMLIGKLKELANGTSTAEDIMKLVKKANDVEAENHKSDQPTKAYETGEQQMICKANTENTAAGVSYLVNLVANAKSFDKDQTADLLKGLKMINKEIDWFKTKVANAALPTCLPQVESDAAWFTHHTDAAIKMLEGGGAPDAEHILPV